jgi:hypothetical protein
MTNTLCCYSNLYIWFRTAQNRKLEIVLRDTQTHQQHSATKIYTKIFAAYLIASVRRIICYNEKGIMNSNNREGSGYDLI